MQSVANANNPKSLKLNYLYKFWDEIEQVDFANEVSKEYNSKKFDKPRRQWINIAPKESRFCLKFYPQSPPYDKYLT